MPLNSRRRAREPLAPGLDLPPPYRAVALREVGDAFSHAKQIAGEAGAGTLVHVGRFDLAEFAVVLEPEEPLRTARRAVYAGLNALANALAVHAPPEKPIALDWPDAIYIDGGLVGGGRLAWPAGADEDAPPPWLVFAAMIRTTGTGEHEPGQHPRSAALDAEGFDIISNRLIESFARHFMAVVDTWQRDGFAEVASSYLSRLTPRKNGTHCTIDENGDLILHNTDNNTFERRPLISALVMPSWLDLATQGPRL
jgi:hypothetical protein